MKQVEFIKLEDTIKQILIDNPKAREDDMLLYITYYESLNTGYTFRNIFIDPSCRKAEKIATFAAVERCRRKIQAECPELASERVKRARAKEEENYKEYARL